MAKKSNKTSHVLNLLTNGSSDPASSPQPAAPQGKITVVDEADTNKRVSGEILKGLKKELAKECNTGKKGEIEDAKPQFCFVNVMEELIRRQDLDRYISEYQVCGCSRCRADVCALALSRLPAKYIVTDSASLPLLLSFYNNRYRVAILTQLIQACLEVKEHPRHEGAACAKEIHSQV